MSLDDEKEAVVTKEKAVLLFSGGVDSTYAAVIIAASFHEIILLSYKVPGMINVGKTNVNVRKLLEIFPGKFKHHVLDITQDVLNCRGGVSDCIRDNLKFNFFYSWCLGCKMTMHLMASKYCLDNNIKYVFDGSTKYDLHSLAQHEEIINYLKKEIYQKKGLCFSPACYDGGDNIQQNGLVLRLFNHLTLFKPSHKKRISFLAEHGIIFNKGVGHQYRSCQPTCILSLPFNFTRLFYKLFFKEKKSDCLRYLMHKLKS